MDNRLWMAGCSEKGLMGAGRSTGVSESSLKLGDAFWKRKKIELHVHMEAAVEEDFYANLNLEGGRFAAHDLPSRRAPFPIFRDFIAAWIDNTRLIRNEEDIENLAIAFAQERKRLNIVYSDVHISPADFSYLRKRFGDGKSVLFDFESLLKAYCRGVQKAAVLFPHIWVRLILDVIWPSQREELQMVVSAVRRVLVSEENRDPRGGKLLVAAGLGGPEMTQNLAVVSGCLAELKEMGLKVEIHSGETVGWESQKSAMEAIGPHRVAHGLAGALVGKFCEGHTIFCPVSNLRTGALGRLVNEKNFAGQGVSLFDLPWKNYLEADVSVGSDDPLLFQTNLIFEHVLLNEVSGAGEEFFEKSQFNAKRAAFDLEALHRAFEKSEFS